MSRGPVLINMGYAYHLLFAYLSISNPFIPTSQKMSEPYDPYVPTAGNPPGATNAKTNKVRQEVDQVINIMQDNIDRVVDRGANIDQLQSKTGKRLDHEVLYKLREYC
ncbi:unnamed protein product [Umbelopsis ramanniana]